MKSNTSTPSSLVAPSIILVVAVAFFCWQLVGLRYTNHDDVYFQLQAALFNGNYLGFANIAALGQARPQAYINMPLVLWAESLAQSAALDAVNIATVVIFYLALTAFLAAVAGRTNAVILAAISAIFFPLHYYFTFPQGYPAMAAWGLTFCLASGALLASHLNRPRPGRLAFSAVLFFLSLWGPEYNFILHPLLLLLVFLVRKPASSTGHVRRTVLIYGLTWFAAVVAYLLFSVAARMHGADGIGRVSMGFSILDWLKSFWILLYKSFLPVSLIDGIWIINAPSLGLPELPSRFSYRTIWRSNWDVASAAAIFLLFCCAIYTLVIRHCRQRRGTVIVVAMLAIAIIPPAVVAGSRHYQELLTGGHLQGHLTTFYSQLGLSTLLFLVVAAVVQRTQGYARVLLALGGTVVLAGLATVTVYYNHLNRQAMMANRQRWDAVELLTRHIHEHKPELLQTDFHSIQLWPVMGVTGIPGDNPPSITYWTTFSRAVLEKPLVFRRGNAEGSGSMDFRYFPVTGGSPLVALSSAGVDAGTATDLTLIAAIPVSGKLVRGDEVVAPISSSQWTCASTCSTNVALPRTAALAEMSFQQPTESRPSLIEQLFSERRHSFFNHFKREKSDAAEPARSDIVIEDWGPKQVSLGSIPNRQPDGTAAIWVKLKGPIDTRGMALSLDHNAALESHSGLNLITGTFAADLFSTPRARTLYLKSADGVAIRVGDLVISGTPSF